MGFLDAFKAVRPMPMPVIDALRRFRLIIVNCAGGYALSPHRPEFHEQRLSRRQIGPRRHLEGRHDGTVPPFWSLQDPRNLFPSDPPFPPAKTVRPLPP